jgi:hypothetical protein
MPFVPIFPAWTPVCTPVAATVQENDVCLVVENAYQKRAALSRLWIERLRHLRAHVMSVPEHRVVSRMLSQALTSAPSWYVMYHDDGNGSGSMVVTTYINRAVYSGFPMIIDHMEAELAVLNEYLFRCMSVAF